MFRQVYFLNSALKMQIFRKSLINIGLLLTFVWRFGIIQADKENDKVRRTIMPKPHKYLVCHRKKGVLISTDFADSREECEQISGSIRPDDSLDMQVFDIDVLTANSDEWIL
jgi:hypothetical protein